MSPETSRLLVSLVAMVFPTLIGAGPARADFRTFRDSFTYWECVFLHHAHSDGVADEGGDANTVQGVGHL